MKLLFRIILLSFMITACVPVFKKEYYLSFEKVSDIETIKVLNKIPVAYSLSRENYTVDINLDDKSGLRLFIRATGIGGGSMVINTEPVVGISEDKRCGVFSVPYPQDDIPDAQDVVVFNWYIFRTGCEAEKIKKQPLTLNFSVSDTHNGMLGVETMPFEIKEKGIKVVFDAI